VLLALSVSARNWSGTAWLGAALVIYLAGVRRTRCRVETRRHRPCRWTVRGYLRSCDYHPGLKRGLPTLYRPRGWWLPDLMWPRYDLARAGYEPRPRAAACGADAVAPGNRAWSVRERVTTLLAVASLVVAIMSFVRDLIAG
jgi:hypothetical protein